jgi:tyrosyl-tRNA synthetase
MILISFKAMNIITDSAKIDEILNRGTIVEMLPTKEEFRKKLLSGEKLRFYIGFDATAPTLHLSHAKNFILLEKFRKLGHEVIVLFGDFTARIGDPTDEAAARKQLTGDEVKANVSKWKELIKPLMDFDATDNPPQVRYNNDWLAKLTFEDVIGLASNLTVQQMIERDMFQRRLKEEKPIYLHEFFYPLMQGYDSVALDVDVELCGTDQIFNALVGRTLLKKLKNKDKCVVAVTLMANPKTGELMSKSKGIGVFLHVSANDMYGQVMAEPDEMMELLFINNTFLSLDEIKALDMVNDPMSVKKRLAFEITNIFHGEDAANHAAEEWNNVFSKGSAPTDLEVISLGRSESDALSLLVDTKLAESRGEARRLIEQGGFSVDDAKITDPKVIISIPDAGIVVRAGKHRFAKIVK